MALPSPSRRPRAPIVRVLGRLLDLAGELLAPAECAACDERVSANAMMCPPCAATLQAPARHLRQAGQRIAAGWSVPDIGAGRGRQEHSPGRRDFPHPGRGQPDGPDRPGDIFAQGPWRSAGAGAQAIADWSPAGRHAKAGPWPSRRVSSHPYGRGRTASPFPASKKSRFSTRIWMRSGSCAPTRSRMRF